MPSLVQTFCHTIFREAFRNQNTIFLLIIFILEETNLQTYKLIYYRSFFLLCLGFPIRCDRPKSFGKMSISISSLILFFHVFLLFSHEREDNSRESFVPACQLMAAYFLKIIMKRLISDHVNILIICF